jgi:putative spermidine/putrescine transport system ATP-binding protein
MTSTATGGQVELRNITKVFPAAAEPAVDDISLEVAGGEFMTLLGPSGSGKTTTLSMIAGFEKQTSGRILIAGRDVVDLPPYKRGLGMVFQHYALFPHLSVRDNVAFPLRRRKVPKKEAGRRANEILELVGLSGFGDRSPAQLSGGQQQRVALARSVVFNPPVLLMDEPLGALDKRLRHQLQGEISRMHRELGITFIFVTHDQEEALALSDRIAVFNLGKIEQVGPARELYENPATLFVADFLGASTIFRGVSRGGQLTGEGYDLMVPRTGSVPSGRPAALVVRPERIRLHGFDAIPDRDTNTLGATVTDVAYQGSYRKVVFRTDAGIIGSAMEQAGAESTAGIDDRVAVTWRVDDAVVVPADPAADEPVPAEDPTPEPVGLASAAKEA